MSAPRDPGTGPIPGGDSAATAGDAGRDDEGLGPGDASEQELGSFGEGAESEVGLEYVSLTRRLRQPRTTDSIALPIVLLVLFLRALPGFRLEELPARILAANPLVLLAALAVYYCGFPLRGLRWLILLRATGLHLRLRDATEIVFISWLVNCLVPAKLGDIYRAYLLRLNYLVSLSRAFGTVFIERVFDLVAIVLLGLFSGFISFRTGLPGSVQLIFAAGIGFVIVLIVGLIVLRNFGRRVLRALPLPHRVVEFYDRFEEGVFALGRRDLPGLAVIGVATGAIWGTEALRLFLVINALGFPEVGIGISGAFFVALAASLLTAVPFTPAGIGIVEAGVVGILTLIYRVPPTEAATIALVDRAISVLSIIVLGSITYVLSSKTKGTRTAVSPEPAGPAA